MSDHQPVTQELRAWIIEQATAGHPPDVVLKSMIASGWNEDSAVTALEATLTGYLGEKRAERASVPPPVPVPEPLPQGARSVVWAGDREVGIVVSMFNPRVVVFSGLLSGEECDEIVALARVRLARSETVQTQTGSSEVNEARTSQGMFFERGEHPVCARLEARVAALMSWPVENGEGLQVLRYGPGAEYKPHYDYFDPDQAGTPTILKRGGQRVASLVCYLNSPALGGQTIFPDVQLDVAPIKGNAVFFSYDRPHPVTRSLHGGAPVIEGEKWVATKWLREGRFD
ncbi:MAG: 2OG-Fe(II) oxygenase [Burkholderiales bacterium]